MPNEVAAALARSAAGVELPDDLRLIATFDHYWIAAISHAEGFEAIVKPDDEGRHFFPVFTEPEAAARGLEAFRADLPGEDVRTTEACGPQVWEVVAREDVVGVVFDYLGPAEPCAFAVGALELWQEHSR